MNQAVIRLYVQGETCTSEDAARVSPEAVGQRPRILSGQRRKYRWGYVDLHQPLRIEVPIKPVGLENSAPYSELGFD
jgi:hypothetical protein